MLDALVDAQRRLDPTLAFRYACRVGMCGSCAMVIDGRERWACRTLLRSLGSGPVTVRPLYHFPLIRDLVVDMAPFKEKMVAVGASLRARRGAGGVRAGRRRQPRAPAHRWRHRVHRLRHVRLGLHHGRPRCAIRRARRVQPRVHARGGQPRRRAWAERQARLLEEDALVRCHGQGNCTAVCPMEISPTDSILALRRRAVLRRR